MSLSERTLFHIKYLSLFAMFTVVLIHSNNLGQLHPTKYNILIQTFFSSTYGWADWAVPYFFIISGFWSNKSKTSNHREFIQKKIKTLLQPYLVWGILSSLLVLPCAFFNNWRENRGLVENTFLQYPDIITKINALLGITLYDACGNRLIGPIADRPLWYIRTLFIIFLFLPLLKIIQKKSAYFLSIIGWICIIFSRIVLFPF